MASSANISVKIFIQHDIDLAEAICVALEMLGFKILRVSTRACQIVACELRRKRVGRIDWSYEYRATIQWDMQPTSAQLHIMVRELQSSHKYTECEEKCEEIVEQIKRTLSKIVTTDRTKPVDVRHGAAKWASYEDLNREGYFCFRPEPDRLLLSQDNGQLVALPKLLTTQHAIVCGPTGAGKTTGIFIPNLIERAACSMIVTEASPSSSKPELFARTAGWRKKAGHQIFYFNPLDMTSTRLNPIDLVRLASNDRVIERAESIADLIISNTSRAEMRADPIWDRAEKLLLTAIILHVAAGDPQRAHVGAIRWYLRAGVAKTRKDMLSSNSELAAAEFEGFLANTSENLRQAVMAGLLTRLNPWLTPQMVALTAKTDIFLSDLSDELFTFYLSAPTRRHDLKGLTSLVFNFLLDQALETKFKNPISLMLDEFTNFGYINGMADLLTIIRKTGVSVVLGIQDFVQLEKIYGQKDAEILFDQPGTSVFIRTRRFRAAKSLSEALGMQTLQDRRITDFGHIQEHYFGKALLTPEDLMALDSQQMVVFTPNTRPVLLCKFEPNRYDTQTALPPPQGSLKEIPESIHKGGIDHVRHKYPDQSETSVPTNYNQDIEQRGSINKGESPDPSEF